MRRYGKPRKIRRRGKPTTNYYTKVYEKATSTNTWVSTQCRSRQAAIEWVRSRELEEALGRDRQSQRRAQTISFGEVYAEWIAGKEGHVSRTHYRDMKCRGDTFWVAYFGGTSIQDVTSDSLRTYLRRRAQGIVPGARTHRKISITTVNNDLVALKALFSFAVAEGYIARSPAAAVHRLPGEIKRRIRTLTKDEEKRLLTACREAATVTVSAKRNIGSRIGGKTRDRKTTFTQTVAVPDYLYPLVYTALYCGFRRRTLLSLRWRECDFTRRRWHVPGEFMKTAADYEAPAPEGVILMLREYREQLSSGAHATKRLAPDSTIFGLSPESSITKSFQRAVKRADLRGFTFHDCRRVYLNRLRDSGVSIETAMALTGHKSIETVLKYYREVPESDLEEAVRRIESSA